MKKHIVAGLILAVTAFGMGSVAEAGSWKFEVTNKSRHAVRSFLTQEDGAWSKNWIRGDKIAPGDTFEMDFGTDEGECEVRTRIVFTDDTYFDETIDYCDVSKIDLFEETMKTHK